MPNYRRAFVPGGCWFFTVNLLERRRALLVDHVDALRAAVQKTRERYPFVIDVVVLPDHIHAVWTLPADQIPLRASLAATGADQRRAPGITSAAFGSGGFGNISSETSQIILATSSIVTSIR